MGFAKKRRVKKSSGGQEDEDDFLKKYQSNVAPENEDEGVSFTDISGETAKLALGRSRMAKYKQFESFSEY